MTNIEKLQYEIQKINERNKRVELPDPFLNSVVPALAFVLSTSVLPLFKKIWLKFRKYD